jgi:hypothetical protein
MAKDFADSLIMRVLITLADSGEKLTRESAIALARKELGL